MKDIVLAPTIADGDVLVQFTAEVSVEKNLAVKVPMGYTAIVCIGGRAEARIPSTEEKRIVDCGKQLLHKKCRIAFVRKTVSEEMAWGFGNINVNNERLQEAYRIGANGKYSVEIAEIGKLLNSFDGEENITTETIRNKTIATIKNVGTAILGKYFANTRTSVFEISAHVQDIRKELLSSLQKEVAFTALGLKLHDLTVDGIHIPEEDLAIIQNRLNANVTEIEGETVIVQTINEDGSIKISYEDRKKNN